jgi:hypothetical protein
MEYDPQYHHETMPQPAGKTRNDEYDWIKAK